MVRGQVWPGKAQHASGFLQTKEQWKVANTGLPTEQQLYFKKGVAIFLEVMYI
jgi:hypothetical protein